MGITLGLETRTGEEVPIWFTRTDSKNLQRHLWALHWKESDNDLVRLVTHLHLDLEPLTKIVDWEEEPLESFLARDPTEERRELWYRGHAAREAAWQDPAVLASTLESLLEALDENPSLFSDLNINAGYFLEGFFHQDVADLLKMVEWAKDGGISKVRIAQG